LAVLSLFALSLFLAPRWIIFWTPVFAFEAYVLIFGVSQFPMTRTITVILAGLMSAWAARLRARSYEQASEIEVILKHLPTPWVLIDAKGSILKSNGAGALCLGSTPEEIAGLSIFEVGSSPISQKERIKEFVKSTQRTSGFTFPFGEIQGAGKNIVAKVFPIPLRQEKASLLVLEEALVEKA
jgi:PAS domain S-box-containing protein